IIPIPGASAITTALSVSGFKAFNYIFLGFLPKKGNTKLFEWLKNGKITFSFYESPKRILKTLKNLEENFGSDIKVFVASELTKMHEKLYRGSIKEVTEKLEKCVLKGEMVVIIS
ncbi:MAG: SAM-dependent methyltransferase, partial [Patescibacteria group bacterium]